ncbi:type I polyketide synthase [Merismopedia glauca]|uniref:Ketosynthase family 3 (KS3) domain-containing protein n=1 Tax=Merismopedia glauca CCAP 1448/3 TaxID=1296344 RepID=A0A2T1C2F1_9CYAN|nr:type I polyketide synthase [Merismopedia glauca]PSB02439.1 hypothetical protein C7B64_13160 [Merismopedia glauca CCAP 1448/3]
MEPVAIIGMGCRFPGGENPSSFWSLLRNGGDAIAPVPSDRWDIDRFYHPEPGTPGKMITRWGGFLKQVNRFDANFFGISLEEAQRIDPQQKLMLEVAWEALEDAGVVPAKLSGTSTGVFLGISKSDHNRVLYQDLAQISATSIPDSNPSIVANRLSFFLQVQGPSMAIDTTCSSALVALHLACQSLQSGESELAIVGGISLNLVPEDFICLSLAGLISPDGRCKTFDARANGYGRGEGCGVVVVKLLREAIANRDNILAVIRGSAVNQNGLSNGFTAPNGLAQQALISKALANAGVSADRISYVETHGTGTPLGDAIEVKSLKAKLKSDRPCWLGSVKTNIGHLEAAAGVASLIKTVLSLQNQEIPAHLHFQQLHPYISLKGTNLAIPTELQPWSQEREPRLAGVSSFGSGGTNAHIILESAPENPDLRSNNESQLLTLSAKTEPALRELARRYQRFIQDNPNNSLADICFTANTGRSLFNYRLAAIADSKEQLAIQLGDFANAKETTGVMTGKAIGQKGAEILNLTSNRQNWSTIAQLYVNGGSINWSEFYQENPSHRLQLPTYPFQRQKCSLHNNE